MITNYEVHFSITDMSYVPKTFRDLLNFLEEHKLVEHLLKVEESQEYDCVSRPFILSNIKIVFKQSNNIDIKEKT